MIPVTNYMERTHHNYDLNPEKVSLLQSNQYKTQQKKKELTDGKREKKTSRGN